MQEKNTALNQKMPRGTGFTDMMLHALYKSLCQVVWQLPAATAATKMPRNVGFRGVMSMIILILCTAIEKVKACYILHCVCIQKYKETPHADI